MKRLLAFLLAVLAVLGLCACEPIPTTDEPETAITETVPATSEVTETVTEENIPNHLDATEKALVQYAKDFGWAETVVEAIVSHTPDLDMLDKVVKTNDTTYKILLTDGTEYIMTIDIDSKEVDTITFGDIGLYPGCADGCH